MEIIDNEWKEVRASIDSCFYCGSKNTITYKFDKMFKIDCHTCDEYSYY